MNSQELITLVRGHYDWLKAELDQEKNGGGYPELRKALVVEMTATLQLLAELVIESE